MPMVIINSVSYDYRVPYDERKLFRRKKISDTLLYEEVSVVHNKNLKKTFLN